MTPKSRQIKEQTHNYHMHDEHDHSWKYDDNIQFEISQLRGNRVFSYTCVHNPKLN